MGLSELSTCAKGCIACGVCTAVVLAIMIPVSILVIAPKMGQHALEVSVMDIPNSTVYDLPDNLHLNHTAKLVNTVSMMQTSMPFSAKLHETQMVMHIPAFQGQWFTWPEKNVAFFTMPELEIHHGTNTFNVATDITLLENTDYFVDWAMMLSLPDLGGFKYGTTVYIAGKPKLTAFGIFSMELTMGKKMNCSYVPTSLDGKALVQDSAQFQTSEESLTARRLTLRVGGMGPVTMSCSDDGMMDSDYMDVVLQNFTRDLACHPQGCTATTTTAAPAMV